MRIKHKSSENNENNIFWITMTDLMTALVLAFIVLFFYSYMTSFYEKIQQSAEREKATQALEQTLKAQKIDTAVDISTGVVKISDLSLFTLNSHELSPEGKKFMEKFVPAYLDSLFTNEYMAEHIDKIIIQGHTDSQTFKGEFSAEEQYMKNMELSLKRAFTVANYITSTKYDRKYGERLRKMVIVEGASYSSPIIRQGKEDYDKSRRVELKLVMKEKDKFLETQNKNFDKSNHSEKD